MQCKHVASEQLGERWLVVEPREPGRTKCIDRLLECGPTEGRMTFAFSNPWAWGWMKRQSKQFGSMSYGSMFASSRAIHVTQQHAIRPHFVGCACSRVSLRFA